MAVEVLKDEKDFLQVKLTGENKALAALVVENLLEDKEVEFAGASEDHPLYGNPVITVRSKSPKKKLEDALDEVKKELKDLQKAVEKL